MAKWKAKDLGKPIRSLEERAQGPWHGQIRVVNYAAGLAFNADGYPEPVIHHRIEQYRAGGWGLVEGEWVPVPVYQEQPDGTLVEIPQ